MYMYMYIYIYTHIYDILFVYQYIHGLRVDGFVWVYLQIEGEIEDSLKSPADG